MAELHNTREQRMKAIVVTDQAAGTGGMKLVERPEPQASINDVLVQVHAAGYVSACSAWLIGIATAVWRSMWPWRRRGPMRRDRLSGVPADARPSLGKRKRSGAT